jgi:hypothetical protein
MKKLGFLLIIILAIIFSACPPLLEDDTGSTSSGDVMSFDEQFELDVYKWFEILDKIAKEGKFVSLDLSKATYKDGNTGGGLIKLEPGDPLNPFSISPVAFDPFPASASGKDLIVSIILPNTAQMIRGAKQDVELLDITDEKTADAKKYAAFRSFTNLRSVKGDNVTYIGNFAFADCTALTEVNFPRVSNTNSFIDIGKYSFMGCTSLKEIKFNLAEFIGECAFKGCTSLSKIDFPKVTRIEKNAFEGCKSLVNVFFEEAYKIEDEAFKNCTGLKKAEFNVASLRGGAVDPRTFLPPLVNPDFELPVYDDFMLFYPSAFTGCKALGVLNIKNAWNVYFAKDVLANTGSAIEIYLFDEPSDGTTSYGHPQNANFLGSGATVTVKKINIFTPESNGKVSNNLRADIKSIYDKITLDVNVNKR